jgi:hypothetical protein
MHQVTIGAAYQFTINPLERAFGFFTNPVDGAILGVVAPIGGNVQMTWGANTQAVYGSAVSIVHGNQVTITGKPNAGLYVMAVVVPVLCAAYQVAFAEIGQSSEIASDNIANIAEAFGAAAIASNAVLLGLEGAYRSQKVTELEGKFTQMATSVATSLGWAGSELQPDWQDLMADYFKNHTQVASPELPLTPMDMGNSVNLVQGYMVHGAKHIYLVASKDLDSVPPDTKPSFIYIDAAGGVYDYKAEGLGQVIVNASNSVTLLSGGGSLTVKNNKVTSGDLTLNCGAKGTITLLNMPKKDVATALVEFTNKSIKLQSGIPPAGATITLEADKGITLQCGTNKLTLDQKGLTVDVLIHEAKAKVQHKETAMMKQMKATLGELGITLAQHTG